MSNATKMTAEQLAKYKAETERMQREMEWKRSMGMTPAYRRPFALKRGSLDQYI